MRTSQERRKEPSKAIGLGAEEQGRKGHEV